MNIATTNVIAKIAAVVAGLGLVAMSFASFAPAARAATTEELQAQINALLAQIAAMQGGSSSASVTFTMDLTIGSTGTEVTALQNWLISKGYSIPAGATGYFGAQTAAALAAYQAANGISPAAGYFGPITRAKVNAAGGATGSTGGSTGSTGGLSGGSGSIDNYSLVSGLNNEEVGEGEEDVEVAGLTLENGDGSDVEVTAVRLVLVQTDNNGGDASKKFDAVADEVSVWLDGDEVGRVDASKFNKDNDYTSTISLDGAVVDSGDDADLTVAVSGVSNLDSDDEDSAWSLDFDQVRYEDAKGASISENPGTAARTVKFVSLTSAADTEFKISDGDEDINDSHVIDVDTNDDTDADVLSFNVEIKGDADVNVDALPVNFDVTGASNVDDVVSDLKLMMDGDEVGSADVATDCIEDADCSAVGSDETYLFDDLDLTLEAGKDYDFTVVATIYGISDASGDTDAGDTIAANFGETQAESADADITDEADDDLASGDITGSVVGEASALYDKGIMVALVGTPTAVVTPGDASASPATSDEGTFTITFDVTAFDGDMWVDHSAPLAAGGSGEADLGVTGTGTVTSTITSPSGATDGTDGFRVREGETERFSVTTHILATASGFFAVSLDDIAYAITDADGGLNYTFNLDDFKTPQVFLTDR